MRLRFLLFTGLFLLLVTPTTDVRGDQYEQVLPPSELAELIGCDAAIRER